MGAKMHRLGDTNIDGTTSRRLIGSVIEVHRQLGPGLLESVYQTCLTQELAAKAIAFEQEVELPIAYKGVELNRRYRIDLIVEQALVVEMKSVQLVLPVNRAQLLTYLRLTKLRPMLDRSSSPKAHYRPHHAA
jgi:GxxExxY protein